MRQGLEHILGRVVIFAFFLAQPVWSADNAVCRADFERLCPQMPDGPQLYKLCFAEHYIDLSPACRDRLSGQTTSPEEAAFSACLENPKGHNPLLDPPSSAQAVHFLRCGVSDKVTFRVIRPFPGESLSDLFQKRWEGKGWFPQPGEDDGWKRIISPDRLRIAVIREMFLKNARGQMAFLTLAYTRRFSEPILEVTPLDTLDMGEELHVLANLTPVRRAWDGKLPVLFGKEIVID